MLHRSSHWLALLALLLSLGSGGYVLSRPTPQPTPNPAASPAADEPLTNGLQSECANAPELRAHTYNPQRLSLIKPCTSVVGTVQVVRHEADGDMHVLLKEDSDQPVLTNSVNDSRQQGDLIVEPQCDYSTVTQTDAAGPCQGAPQTPGASLLAVGAHVRVVGDYVTDQQHGWNEIHIVDLVEKI